MDVIMGLVCALLVSAIIMSMLALRALRQTTIVRNDIIEFRRQLIKIAASNRSNRRF